MSIALLLASRHRHHFFSALSDDYNPGFLNNGRSTAFSRSFFFNSCGTFDVPPTRRAMSDPMKANDRLCMCISAGFEGAKNKLRLGRGRRDGSLAVKRGMRAVRWGGKLCRCGMDSGGREFLKQPECRPLKGRRVRIRSFEAWYIIYWYTVDVYVSVLLLSINQRASSYHSSLESLVTLLTLWEAIDGFETDEGVEEEIRLICHQFYPPPPHLNYFSRDSKNFEILMWK